MRLAELRLTRFGHFTDHRLAFPRGPGSDFHIILGPNEAGKSTMVEGYLNLLYKIRANTTYAFRHERDTLEVSALLEDGDSQLAVTRLRRASADLVGPEGVALPEATLGALLRGVSEEAYRSLYCLDDETIEKGGDDILASRGDLGQLLFSAASGMTTFNDMLETQRQADRAFHIGKGPGRNSTKLAAFKKQLAELDKAIKDADMTAPEYRRLRDATKHAQNEAQKAKDRHSELLKKAEDLRAKLLALPIQTKLQDLRAARLALGWQPKIDSDVRDELDALAKTRSEHQTAIETRAGDLDIWKSELDRLEIDEAAAGLAMALVGLAPLRSRAETAFEDLPNREAEREAIDREVARLLADLGQPPHEQPELSTLRLERAQDANRLYEAAEQTRASAARECHEAEKAFERLRQTQSAQANPMIDPAEIEAVLRDLQAVQTRDVLFEARDAVRLADERLAEALLRLAVGGCAFDTVPAVPITAQGASQLVERIAASERKLAPLQARQREDQQAIAGLRAEMENLTHQGAAPNDTTAQALRDRRNALWQEHLDALSLTSAQAYAEARDRDDQATAARLAEADRLSDLRQTERELARLDAVVAERTRQIEDVVAEREAHFSALDEALRAIGLPPGLTAPELVDWLKAYEVASAQSRLSEAAQAKLKDAEARAASVSIALAEALVFDGAELGKLIEQGNHQILQARAETQLREQTKQSLSDAEAGLAQRKQQLERAEMALAEALIKRDTALAALGVELPPEGSVGAALRILGKVQQAAVKRDDLKDRIGKMRANATNFAQQISRLSLPWPKLADKPALEQLAELDRMADAYRGAATRERDLEDLILQAQDANGRDVQALGRIDARAETIAAAWPQGQKPRGFDAIKDAVADAAQAHALDAQLADQTQALLKVLELETIEAALQTLADATEAGLRTAQELLAPDLSAAADARDEAVRALSVAEQNQARVIGDGDAAALRQDRASLIEAIRYDTEAALQRRVGLLLAQKALARYRETHRGAMLAATEQAFVALTGGAYTGLSTQQDGASESLIAHRRSDGRSLRADAKTMSKGTRFQLYLALRLAGYRQMAATGTSLPFLCDDIFETFDEARTEAACRLLGEIGMHGQALYFTHHAHVAEIARATVPDVQIHQI
jgi:uncharacterized protein YhaN